jgi:hypothetical protein
MYVDLENDNALFDFEMLCLVSIPFSVSQKWTTAKKMFAVWLVSKYPTSTDHACHGA